jgi:hypothetical protein
LPRDETVKYIQDSHNMNKSSSVSVDIDGFISSGPISKPYNSPLSQDTNTHFALKKSSNNLSVIPEVESKPAFSIKNSASLE